MLKNDSNTIDTWIWAIPNVLFVQLIQTMNNSLVSCVNAIVSLFQEFFFKGHVLLAPAIEAGLLLPGRMFWQAGVEFHDEVGFVGAGVFIGEEDVEAIINDCKDAIENFDPNNILEVRRIQGFDETVLRAIYGTITHLEFHAGQIVYQTRLLLAEQYTLSWVPQTKEQAAQ